ncbi:MAG: MMPL family transporter [Acidimicrobiales bacterium]
MSWARRTAALPCGRWTKWFVLAFWIVVFAVAQMFFASKLNSAQQNDASSWLPHNAESTQVVDLAKKFTPSDVFPVLVVYERSGGQVTAADRAKVTADVQRFAGVQDVTGKITGPIPSQDGRALQVVVPMKINSEGNGWQQLTPRVEQMRSIAHAGSGGLHAYVTGPGGYFADFANVFSGFDTTLLYITAVIVVVILLLTPTFASGLGGQLREAEAWSGRPGVLAAVGNWDGRCRLLWAMSVVISLTAERASWL